MTTYSTAQKPNLVTGIAVMTLLSGIVNIFWGLIASLTVLATLVGVVCTPFTVLPTILGVFEIIFAAKLLANPVQPVRPSPYIAAFEIACILAGNAFSMIVGGRHSDATGERRWQIAARAAPRASGCDRSGTCLSTTRTRPSRSRITGASAACVRRQNGHW